MTGAPRFPTLDPLRRGGHASALVQCRLTGAQGHRPARSTQHGRRGDRRRRSAGCCKALRQSSAAVGLPAGNSTSSGGPFPSAKMSPAGCVAHRVVQLIRGVSLIGSDAMTDFTWTTAGSSDWSTPSNWFSLEQGEVPPPGAGDIATFGDLASDYTVNVTTNIDVADILIDTSTSTATISISGSLTTDDIVYFSPFDGTPTSMTVNAGGSLDIATLLDANSPETITIAGTEGGGRLVLGNPTVGGAGDNITFAFANTSPTALNTGVIQIDDTGVLLGGPTTQTITDVANGNEFVVPDDNFAAGDTVTLDENSHVLTVDQGTTTVFTMDNIFLEAGATNSFVASGDIIQAVCYARGTMLRTPDGELSVEKLRPGKQVVTLVDGQEIAKTVVWLGHRRIDIAGHPRPETVAPVRIRATPSPTACRTAT